MELTTTNSYKKKRSNIIQALKDEKWKDNGGSPNYDTEQVHVLSVNELGYGWGRTYNHTRNNLNKRYEFGSRCIQVFGRYSGMSVCPTLSTNE